LNGPEPVQLESDVREAVASGDYDSARRLWEGYAAGLRASIANDPAASASLERLRALIEWTRQTSAAERARMQDELANLGLCLRYADPPSPEHHILRLRG
jgi:hypothetical protein